MRPILNSLITPKKGFTLLEFLLSLTILTILVTSYTAIQNTVTEDYVYDNEICEQLMQMNTAMDCLKEVCYMAYAAEITPATLLHSKQAVFYFKDESNKTKIIRFYLERYSGVLYESIQGTSSPGVIQLAVEIGDLDFLWLNPPERTVLEVSMLGGTNPPLKIKRSFFLRNLQ